MKQEDLEDCPEKQCLIEIFLGALRTSLLCPELLPHANLHLIIIKFSAFTCPSVKERSTKFLLKPPDLQARGTWQGKHKRTQWKDELERGELHSIISHKPAVYKMSPPRPGGSLSVDALLLSQFKWLLEFASTKIVAAHAINWLNQKENRHMEQQVVQSTLSEMEFVCTTLINNNNGKVKKLRHRALTQCCVRQHHSIVECPVGPHFYCLF